MLKKKIVLTLPNGMHCEYDEPVTKQAKVRLWKSESSRNESYTYEVTLDVSEFLLIAEALRMAPSC